MIIQCEECGSKFDLNEDLLKQSGSRVKCSVCQHIFTVFPKQEEDIEKTIPGESPEETIALDSPPNIEEAGFDDLEGIEEDAFDKVFEDALGDDIEDSLDDKAEQSADEEISSEKIEEEPAPVSVKRKKKKGFSKALLIGIVIILLLIIGAILVFLFMPDVIPSRSSKTIETEKIDPGALRLSFKNVNGNFIHSNLLGQLFVIRGDVVNNNPDRRSFILLKATIYDVNGKIVRRKLIYAGNTYEDDKLINMTLEDIDMGLKRQAGKDNRNVNIPPSGTVPFMIVFENLPDNLGEFEVEAVSSSSAE